MERGILDRMSPRPTAFVLLSLLLVFFHLGTLGIQSSSSPLFDDVMNADYDYHGALSLWTGILPRERAALANLYPNAIWGAYTGTQGWVLRRIGVGPCQFKIVPALFGLAGLMLFAAIPLALGLAWYHFSGLLCLGFSKPFFDMTHTGRPEGYVFFAMALNWSWFFLAESRLVSFLAGLVAVAAISFHSAAVLLLIPLSGMLASSLRQRGASSKLAWWLVGASAGAVLAVRATDVEAAMESIHLTYGTAILAPPILRWHGRPFSILVGALRYFYFASKQGYAWHLLLSAILLLLLMQLRDFRRADPHSRRFLGSALLTLLGFALFQASGNGSYYVIYAMPLLLAAFFEGIDRLRRGEARIGFPEQLFLACAHVAVVCVLFGSFGAAAALSLAACLLLRLAADFEVPWIWRWSLLAGACAAGLLASSPGAWSFAFYLMRNRPALLFLIVGLPWCLLLPRATRLNRAFVAYCAFIGVALLSGQLRSVYARRSENRCEPRGGEAGRTLSALRRYRRLVAPEQLWFDDPSLAFQSADALRVGSFDPAHAVEALREYHPDFILWPVDGDGGDARIEGPPGGPGDQRKYLRWGSAFDTPYGRWRELRLVEGSGGDE